MNPPKIFISATSGDLSSARQIAKEALLTINCHPVEQTNFEPDWRSVTDMLRGKIGDCQALIHLVGFRYGAEPDRSTLPDPSKPRSYTQMEYDVARELKLRVYTFILPETYPFDVPRETDGSPKKPEAPELIELQKKHRGFIQSSPHLYEEPANDLELRTRIIALREQVISLEQEQQSIAKEVKTTRHWGLWAVTMLLLVLSVILWGIHKQYQKQSVIEAQQAKMKEQQSELLSKLTSDPEYLRARLRKGIEDRARVDIEAAKKKGADWRQIDEIEKKKNAALYSIEALLMTITNGLNGEPDPIFLEAAQLLDSKGVQEALEYLQAKEPEINAKQSRLKAIKDEATRQHHESLRSSMLHGDLLYITFSFDSALKKFEWIVQQAPEWWESQNNMGSMLHAMAQYEAAERHFRAAETQASNDKERAITLSNLAMVLLETDRLKEAEPLMLSALAMDEANLGRNAPIVAIRLNNLALCLKSMDRLAEAKPLYIRALKIDEKTYGLDHPNVARGLNNLGSLLQTMTQMKEAEQHYRRALKIDQLAYGPKNPISASDASNLASLLQATDRLEKAEPLFRDALKIHEANYGPNHPTVASDHNNMGGLLKKTNRIREAETHFRQALKIATNCHGPNHSDVALYLHNLAGVLEETNRQAEAEPLLRHALKVFEDTYGSKHSKVAAALNSLGSLLNDMDRPSEAEPLLRRAFDITKTVSGPDHPMVATILLNVASLFLKSNQPLEAEALIKRALEIDESNYGPDDTNVAICLNSLTHLLERTNRLAEAEPLSLRIVRILLRFQARTGHRHPHELDAIEDYYRLASELKATESDIHRRLNKISLDVGLASAAFDEIWQEVLAKKPTGPFQVVITYVQKGSKAESLGVQVGDIIVSCNEVTVTNVSHLLRQKSAARSETIQFEVVQEGKRLAFSANPNKLGIRFVNRPLPPSRGTEQTQ